MKVQYLIFAHLLLSIAIDIVLRRLADLQRKKSLPAEVADIYDADRYTKYLQRVADHKKVALVTAAIDLVISVTVICLNPFPAIERMCGENLYWIALLSILMIDIPSEIVSIASDYYEVFHIEEKYDLNRMTKRKFAKDTARETILDTILSLGLHMFIVFVGTHLRVWTNDFTFAGGRTWLVLIALIVVLILFAFGISLISIWMMRRKYKFVPLEEGELRDRIMELQKGCRKQVKHISVYDESKNSTSKNAFLLRFLWYREFGIADNFIRENSEDELLAVLSHEIGHLKQKRFPGSLISNFRTITLLVIVVLLMMNPAVIYSMNTWIRESFRLTVNNYMLIEMVLGIFMVVLQPLSILQKYESRRKEYDADREAVRNGYGEALIDTFKKASRDELINVNPHPVIEFLEYGHPGMYNRIKAIRDYKNKIEAK